MSIPSSVGRYRIDRVLGSGAFASVWLGHDDALAAPVAIKVLSGSLLDDLDVRNRFLEEARILRRADSERLVRVHDIGELPDGRPYFVMSYADRGTLGDRMRERPLPAAEAIALAEEIAYGVEVVNRLGVIHRDLKPSNVLFQSTPDGGEKLLIADLGLAKAIAHASGAFTLPVGTPGYMSPEQARFGGGLDVRADVYGLGALTYHMLTGRPPGPAPVKVPPSELRVELPPGLDEVVLRAMEVERENRWATAEAFARALTTLRSTIPPGSAPNVQGQGQGQRHGPGQAAPPVGASHHEQQGPPQQQQQQQQQQGGYGQSPAGGAPQQGEPQQAHGGYGPPQQAGAAHQQGQPPQQGQGGYGPPVPPPGAAGQRGGVPPEPATAPDSVSQQDVDRTAQVPLPPNARRQQPDPEPRTVVDSPEAQAAFQNVQPPHQQPGPQQGGVAPEDDRTIAMPVAKFPGQQGQQPQEQQGQAQPGSTSEGATAIFSTYQEQGGQGGQGRAGGPGGPGVQQGGPGPQQGGPGPQQGGPGPQQGGPGPQQGGPGPQQGGPGGPSGPGRGRGGGKRRPKQATDGKMRKRMIAVAIGAAIVVFALVGGLLLGQIGSGGKAKKPDKGKVPADFVAVADASGKIKAFVPKVWPKLATPTTWQPTGVGLAADAQSRPVLRATSGTFQQFLSSTEKTPGVFIGLTTDSGQGKLPPARAAVHAQCTKGQQESYTSPSKNLTGTITRFTACKTGTPTITEVGLTDKSGKFGAWVRVKEIDGRKATNDILNNLTLTAP